MELSSQWKNPLSWVFDRMLSKIYICMSLLTIFIFKELMEKECYFYLFHYISKCLSNIAYSSNKPNWILNYSQVVNWVILVV